MNQEEMQQLVEEVQDVAIRVHEMNVSLENAVKQLRAAADYLDKVWKDCKKASAVGTSVEITGGVLTILGALATVMTVGAATPLLVAGTAFGMAGATTNLGTMTVEAIINSTVIRQANRAVEAAHSTIQAVGQRINRLKSGNSLAQLVFRGLVIGMLDDSQLVASLLKGCDLLSSVSSPIVDALKAGIMVVNGGTKALAKAGTEVVSEATESMVAKEGAKAVTKAGTEAAYEAAGSMVAKGGTKAIAKAGTEAASEAAESAVAKGGSTAVGKAGIQGGAKAAGGVVMGISAFFLILDVIDLSHTVSDIVNNEGSNAARSLRAKADKYEAILNHQKGK